MMFGLALYEKLAFRFLDIGGDDVYHIGGTSGGHARSPVGNYIGLRFLKLVNQKELTEGYSLSFDRGANMKNQARDIAKKERSIFVAMGRVEKAIVKIQERWRVQ